MTDINDIKNLLNQVRTINTHYNKINELSGENFNVFKILKLETSEVRMHSSLIAELLNPNGSHGQKDIFLRLFADVFCFRGNIIDTASCTVEVEKHTGKINIDRTEGGRIDILITDKYQNQIIIENKIYAGDQHNQILRYFKQAPKADLIYLSLDGREPEEYSKGVLESGKEYACKSYSVDIAKWLEACRKEAATLPILRESITQYLHLINHLTNQSSNNTMKREVATLLEENLESSFIIADNIDNALAILLEKFTEELEVVATELNLNFSHSVDIGFKVNYRGFSFYNDQWKNVGITFQFWGYDKLLTYGFTALSDPNKINLPKELDVKLKAQFRELVDINFKENGWWPLHLKMEEPYDNWSKYEAWKAIKDGTMQKVFKEKIKYLIDLAQQITL